MNDFERVNFLDYLEQNPGGLETDDLLAAVLPLFEQVHALHEQGQVAPLDGVEQLFVSHDKLWFQNSQAQSPKSAGRRLEALQKARSQAFAIIGSLEQKTDIDEGSSEVTNRLVSEPTEEELKRPLFLTHYTSWEHVLGHHDALSDVYSLGLITASLALGLNFCSRDSLEAFVEDRQGLATVTEGLHPAVALMLARMTELNRHERLQDLSSIIHYLKNYRDQPDTGVVDFATLKGFGGSRSEDRKTLILQYLRDRLFELSKRNRLVYFRSTLKTVNLTEGSVPLEMKIGSIRPEQLFTWQKDLEKALSAEETINLNKYLRFEDAPWLPGALDGIRRDANRDIKEYGFAQLRLVLVFLRWHNLKEDPDTRIASPLLLLPITLVKKKGVKDSYQLTPASTLAEVNPALRYYLKQLYDLDLPETLDLKETSLDIFHELLQKQIQASEKAVELVKIDRPQIDLIHAQAKKRLDRFRQRQRVSGRHVRTWESLDYSYKPENFQPLGLQLFLHRVKPPSLALDSVLGGAPQLRKPGVTEVTTTAEKYQLRQGTGNNPYRWDFDLCSLTLGNFNYRKMTLVRDYNVLLNEERENRVFDEVFSDEPQDRGEPPRRPPLKEQHLIVDSDPTQVSAIAWAREGRNMIIQGPPGTGKSQTITNLVADTVARGKRVLFVCEKRAALDVVYHRLAQSGLQGLASLIHDSQADKKLFIMDLKASYEGFLAKAQAEQDWEQICGDLAHKTQHELAALQAFGQAMCQDDTQAGVNLRELLQRLIALRDQDPELDSQLEEALPPYKAWTEHGETVKKLCEVLKDLGERPHFSQHPLSSLGQKAFSVGNPVANLRSFLELTLPPLDRMQALCEDLDFDFSDFEFAEWLSAVDLAKSALFLSQKNLLGLLNQGSPEKKVYDTFEKAKRSAQRKLEKAQKKTMNWREKLSPDDTTAALKQAQSWESSVFRFFRPAYYRMQKLLKAHYSFEAHKVAPTWTQVLGDLQIEHELAAALSELEEELCATWDVEDLQQVEHSVDGFAEASRGSSAAVGEFRTFILEDPEASDVVDILADFDSELNSLNETLAEFLRDHGEKTLALIREARSQLETGLKTLPDLMPTLSELVESPPAFFAAVCELEWDVKTFEAALAKKSLQQRYRENRELSRFESWLLQRHVQRAGKTYKEWMRCNGARIVQRVQNVFLNSYRICNSPAAQLTAEEKVFKKIFNRGRRELENEFKKTMRYKSVRALASGDSGEVVFQLKPIWLMSPLSISDILPLEEGQFDLVIFDEASQIRLEEAIPTVYRASQVIVVGDEMQLPPSNFFSASGPEEDGVSLEDEGELVQVDLSAESFLSHTSTKLASTLLGWHYRSRHEALISYSNRAFYNGQLLTIPDRKSGFTAAGEIQADCAEDSHKFVDALLQRSISFHFMKHGVYEKRRNLAEAEYLAQLVKQLLNRETGLTLGVVAFSEAQQNEIEGALNRLASLDKDFSNRLSAEVERHEEDQFCGLFVKNLENVQGDERDIILLSICYAPDKNGKMRMNFGPINRAGGEKRLNVIFSRARQHMVVVSSIAHGAITNDYNDGARCLKGFLEYSAAISLGDLVTADRVLRQVDAGARTESAQRRNSELALDVLEQELQKRGLRVSRDVGQSNFRVDLAVRLPEAASHQVGILLDGDAHYAIADPLERYVLRPSILRAFGWTVVEVLMKDLERDIESVLERIERVVKNPEEPVSEHEPEPEIEPEIKSEPELDVAETPALEPEAESEPEPEQESAGEPASSQTQYFEYRDEKSAKFWEITISDSKFTVRYGKVGNKGQSRTKVFDSPEQAEMEAKKVIRSKIRKGYGQTRPPTE